MNASNPSRQPQMRVLVIEIDGGAARSTLAAAVDLVVVVAESFDARRKC